MTKQEWTTAHSPEAMLEILRGTARPRDLRLCSVNFCRRIWQHLTPECQSAIEFAVDYAHEKADEDNRKAIYASINAMCFYVDGDSSANDRLTGFAAEAVLCTLFGTEDVLSIRNYAATCAIASSRAVVEVLAAAAELQGSSESELDRIADDERRVHCDVIRSMFQCPE